MTENFTPIPVIDIFAGPGGLGEGFSASFDDDRKRHFQLVLSIEKEENAHKTLELRAFFRQFESDRVPDEYYAYLRGEITRDELFAKHPAQSRAASHISWHAELGSSEFPSNVVDQRIKNALGGARTWVLIGGPPCQAYSTVGRSRLRGTDPEGFEKDPRHFLYKEYLRILAVHKPPLFIFENVKGILSSRVNGENIFTHILSDLQEPDRAMNYQNSGTTFPRRKLRYTILSLSEISDTLFLPKEVSRYVIESEKYGIPQARHRVILLGVREDIAVSSCPLETCEPVNTWDVICDLPKIRSGLSREADSAHAWVDAIRSCSASDWFRAHLIDERLRSEITKSCEALCTTLPTGGRFIRSRIGTRIYSRWYCDERLQGVCNHSTRFHMRADLHRYMFSSCFSKVFGRSPLLKDFPEELLPKHNNVQLAIESRTRLFSDRFRVQLPDIPATTITSHIAKDGHYFIHPDPLQCRSLTVREAARLQTFPDNYFFEGSQTSQYEQVGNAVPPLLARSIAGIVFKMIQKRETILSSNKKYI